MENDIVYLSLAKNNQAGNSLRLGWALLYWGYMADESQTTQLPKGKEIGKVTHFFDKIGVAVITVSAGLKVGDTIVIAGHNQEFEQSVTSMQVEHESVEKAKKGDEVGLKVDQAVKEGDRVYLQA
jgi:translation elongation factor EF-1alpha